MIKKLAALMVAVLMIFSVATVANGPLLGVSFVPYTAASVPASFGTLAVGWDFGSVNIETSTSDFTSYDGVWTVGALWTPSIGTFGYRAGARVVFGWDAPAGYNGVYYDGFEFVVGVSSTWGPVQLYGDLVLTAAGTLGVAPVVGINILFGDLIPDASI